MNLKRLKFLVFEPKIRGSSMYIQNVGNISYFCSVFIEIVSEKCLFKTFLMPYILCEDHMKGTKDPLCNKGLNTDFFLLQREFYFCSL